MGDMADIAQELADDFDSPDQFDSVTDAPMAPQVKKNDPMRPTAKRGRYTLPNPENGRSKSWRRVSNTVKPFEDTYHLELWKQRNVVKGVCILARDGRLNVDGEAKRDVKLDRERLNNIAETAQDVAEAYKMADEGTSLHASVEIVNHAAGDLNRVPVHHRTKVRMYLNALAANGLSIVPGMIERVTASAKYQTAGTFDMILRLADGSYAMADLKTGDDLELSLPAISAQLDCYEDGVNNTGIFDGQRYDTSIKVRTDFGLVIHLPSTRDEVTVLRIDLAQGRKINECNMRIFETRKIKARHVSSVFDPDQFQLSPDALHQHWSEQLNACQTRNEMIAVAVQARSWGQWTDRLAGVARKLESEMAAGHAVNRMGS